MNKQDQMWLGIAAIALVVVYFVSSGGIKLPDNLINVNLPPGSDAPPDNSPPPVINLPANNLAPTTLNAFASPDPVNMGAGVYGQVVGNGYNYPITITAKLVGPGTTQTLGGMLDADGHFGIYETMYIPGYWEFYAEAGAVKSNTVRLTVVGIKINAERASYSKTFSDSIKLEVFSNMHGNAAIIANDPAHSVSYPVTNCVVSTNGYGTVSPSLDFLPNGDLELDVIFGGQKASDFEGSTWVSVGR